MSIRLPLIKFKDEDYEFVQRLKHTINDDYSSKECTCYDLDDVNLTIDVPLFYYSHFLQKNVLTSFPNSPDPIMKDDVVCKAKPLTPQTDPLGKKRDQIPILKEVVLNLYRHNSSFLWVPTSIGKTFMMIWLMTVSFDIIGYVDSLIKKIDDIKKRGKIREYVSSLKDKNVEHLDFFKKYKGVDNVLLNMMDLEELQSFKDKDIKNTKDKKTIMKKKKMYKTVVICHMSTINRQWKEEIERFTNLNVRLVESENYLKDGYDVYIMGVEKSLHFERLEFKDVGLLIFDEAHICPEKLFTKVIFAFNPMYIIGSSATPDANVFKKLLYSNFGGKKSFIKRKEVKNFKVIKYNTHIEPVISYTQRYNQKTQRRERQIDWTGLISSLSENIEILDIVKDSIIENYTRRFNETDDTYEIEVTENILILCTRSDKIREVDALYEILTEEGLYCSKYIGNSTSYDKDAPILITTVKKAGTGFNDTRFTILYLLSDTKDVRQYEGRIRTNNNTIYDFVHYHPTLEKHYDLREEWFKERGGEIEYKGTPEYYEKKKKEVDLQERKKKVYLSFDKK
jgi:hypothetical protein